MSAAAVATATTSASTTTTLSDTARGSSAGDGSNSVGNGMVDRDETAHHNLDQQNQPLQLHQQQHQLQQETKVTATSSVDAESTSSNRSDNPLPSDLRRILVEVSRTGSCSWLSWTEEGVYHEGMPSVSTSRANSSSPLVGSSPGAPASLNLIGVAASSTISNTSGPSASRQPFAGHRRPPYAAAGPQVPPRKKHRNGIHKSNRRRFVPDGTAVGGGIANAAGGRKRPLLLIRTTATTAPGIATAGSTYSAGSVGSGRTSGSEPDDSTQYECDSDTTNSEISFERRDHHLSRQHQRVNSSTAQASKLGTTMAAGEEEVAHSSRFKTLREAFRVALGLVLDHFYKSRGGYKLSPAEKRRNETLQTNSNNNSGNNSNLETMNSGEPRRSPLSSEAIFRQRRQRLTVMLSENESGSKIPHKRPFDDGPPFTIQRVAEVLVAPERYYTQTHKLCNCLEKLLLVTSSTEAFGGSTGGDTSQSRREERELAALADEKGRQESELRQRRLRRRQSSPTDEVMGDVAHDGSVRSQGVHGRDDSIDDRKAASPEKKSDSFDVGGRGSPSKSNGSDRDPRRHSDPSSQELLEAAARASLRTKFDHVGIDPHSSAAAAERDVRAIAENRGMTNSPPPPSLAIAAASNMALPGHGVAGFVRQHLPEQTADHQSLARVPSPILFSPGNDSPIHAGTNMHMLQLHHAAALAGVSMTGSHSPLDLMTIDDATGSAVRTSAESAFLEVEHASNSDADSESDDVSLDDSASDRSDGSDSGSATHHEPFTAARAMALNRMQQQQRLQSRAITSLTSSLGRGGLGSAASGTGGIGGEGFRPPADSEYQSGDSIDSMRAEDSGGSDSSSSDLAD